MTVLEHWFEEVWNKRNVEAIDKLWVPEKIVHGLPNTHGGQVETKAAFKTFHTNFCSAFPDLHIHVEDTVTEGRQDRRAPHRDRNTYRVKASGYAPTEQTGTLRWHLHGSR